MLSFFATQPLLILLSAFAGIFLGMLPFMKNLPLYVVEVFLMLLLYIVFLSVHMRQILKAGANLSYTGSALAINFIITPCLAYALGLLFLADSVPLRMGLAMLLVTPCTDWYLVFTRLSKGNVEINLAILPLQLLLQGLLLPIYLYIFFGNVVSVDWGNLVENMAFVLLLPFVCALCTQTYIRKRTAWKNLLEKHGEQAQLTLLCLAVCAMFATQGLQVVNNPLLFIKLFMPLLCFFCIIFWVAAMAAKMLRFSPANSIALHFTTLARNSPLALAIAVTAFPKEPLIALALIIGPLLELPVLSLAAHILRKKHFSSK